MRKLLGALAAVSALVTLMLSACGGNPEVSSGDGGAAGSSGAAGSAGTGGARAGVSTDGGAGGPGG
ncbi:MAG TPA: hypothetical protein PKA88_39700, partial [Polyangiaceae bacterium]|nr:hypothetical protein [Polyangiaceae bacterium]